MRRNIGLSLVIVVMSSASDFYGVHATSMDFSVFERFSLGDLPKSVSKDQEKDIISKLETEANVISKSLVDLKRVAKTRETSAKKKHGEGKNLTEKDKKFYAEMDQWDVEMARMNEKAKISSTNVLSKLRNAIHFVKKGALSGNAKAREDLVKVVQKMGSMVGKL